MFICCSNENDSGWRLNLSYLNMSQLSQLSNASTIPYELIHNQDDDFINELDIVDRLYFNNSQFEVESTLSADCSDSDSDTSVNYESDSDNDGSVVFLTDPSIVDEKESQCVEKFKNETCKCSKLYSRPCSLVVEFNDVLSHRESCKEMTTQELDLIIKAQLSAQRLSGGTTSSKKHKIKHREKPSQKFFFNSQQVCRELFCFAHGIERKKMQRIAQSLDTDGITARVHGLTKSVPKHALNEQDILRIKTFICRYAKDNALPLPGRLPNFRQSHVLLLPSDKSIADIHQLYEHTANDMEFRSISLRTFQRTWLNFCPHISVSKPCTDLCQKCQGYCVKVVNSGQFNEEEKVAMLADYTSHVIESKKQRDYYRAQCELSKNSFDELSLGQKHGNPPCTVNKKFHYSWDYAQQVYYPHHSRQVGPIFFKTPRKCDVFGVCSEGSGRQTFYLVDEAESKGKGANSVVSMVHHYFQYYGLGETDACIHFDNCCGQNKNNVVVQYAMWRVMTGLHQQLELAMMITGHTKFHPDWHFGVWKCRWRNSNAETMDQVAQTVRDSSRNGHNIPQLVNDEQKPVLFLQWKLYLSQYFKPLKNLSKFHHFSMRSDRPGIVQCKVLTDSPPVDVNILKKDFVLTPAMPEPMPQSGLDLQRQWYLYEQIRDFCSSKCAKDICCPKPTAPKQVSQIPIETKTLKTVNQKRKQSLLM